MLNSRRLRRRSGMFRWHKAFSEIREELTDEARTGRSSISSGEYNTRHLRELHSIECSFSGTVIQNSIVYGIVTNDLQMRKYHRRLETALRQYPGPHHHVGQPSPAILAKERAPMIPQPPYSPDVATPDFSLF